MRIVRLMIRGAVIGVLALSCASCGPRMRIQPSIQPFEQMMPTSPTGTVPTGGSLDAFTRQQSELATSPVPATPVTLRNGRIYYGYYCLMCHGSRGDGNGPVGESYVPKPADLSSPAVAGLTDGEIYGRMLIGVGHSPVMNQTVQPGYRWPIVMYVRTFSNPPAATGAR